MNSVSLRIAGASLDGDTVDIDIRDGIIAAVQPAADTAIVATRTIDARGLHAFPSFRNAHTHVAMVLFRGYGDDMPLMEWLQTRIWPAEGRLTHEHVYHGARLGILEMIRGGTTFFNEMYWHRPAIVEAVHDMGVRAVVGQTLIDIGDPAVLERQKRDLVQLARERKTDGRVTLAAAPHSIYTVPFDELRRVADVAGEYDLLVHIHLSETAGEVDRCIEQHGCRPTELLERAGLLNDRLIAVHGQFLDDDELGMLGAARATLVTNPAANLKLATAGIFPYSRARRAGVRVCIGTDGAASNNTLSMIESMKLAALLQKHRDGDAATLPAHDVLDMATTAAADAFRAGRAAVAPGSPADLILVDFDDAATQPVHDPVSALVYAAHAGHVHTTICDGRVLMHARRVEICDEREVIESATRAARDVTA